MQALYLVSVWLHILAAATWIGGMVFLAVALVPALRSPAHRSVAAALFNSMSARLRWPGWVTLGLLLASGVVNLAYRVGWAGILDPAMWRGPFGRVLGVKLALVAVVFVLSAAHDFRIGPRAVAAWRADAESGEARRLRRAAGWIGRVNMLLALVILAIAVVMVRGWPE